MADLIDRDALLKDMGLTDAVKYGNKDAEQQYRSYSTWMSYEIADSIRDAPAVNRWISCSERLPENEGIVLVYYREIDMVYTGGLFRDKSGWSIDCCSEADSYCDFDKITHWMPLPEPPEKE